MQSPSVVLLLAALLLWLDSLPNCTSSFVLARHAETSQILASTQNIGACQDFTDFHQTLAVNISLTGVLSKIGKSKKQSPSPSNISFSAHNLHTEAVTEIRRLASELSKMG
jgi:hypothetical protein